jgi:ribosomal protein S12 methylthiotransferase
MLDDVPDATKRERLERLTELQRALTAERYESRVGTVSRFIVDRVDESGRTTGRLPWQADDIDGITVVDEPGVPGELMDVAVEEVVDDYDFRASMVTRIPPVIPKPLARTGRSLPLAVTVGTYGR